MRYLLIFLLCLLAASGFAASNDRVVLDVTVTNLPVIGNNLAFTAPAAKTLIWSNVSNPTFVATNTTVNGCATNLFLQMASYAPWTPRPTLTFLATNKFRIEGQLGQSILATASGTWATLTLSTNAANKLTPLEVPMASIIGDTNRTNIASLAVKGLSDYSTNALGSNSPAVAHLLSLNTNSQRALGRKKFDQLDTSTNLTTIYGGTNNAVATTNAPFMHGSNVNFFGGYSSNIKADKMISTSLVNYANAISSPGTNGSRSENLGTGANANQDDALAVGSSAFATNTSATALGNNAIAGGNGSLAAGKGAGAYGPSTIALGNGAAVAATGTNSIALGSGSEINAGHINAIVIGTSVSSDASGQIKLGASGGSQYVQIGGRVIAEGGYTNNVFFGTNLNRGDWADQEFTLSSLANGNNIAVPGTNVFIRLAAGPTAAFTICGFAGGRDGRLLEVWNDTGQAMTVAHQSGVDPTAANRIITSGADVVFGTNVYVTFRYSAARARWKLSGSRE